MIKHSGSDRASVQLSYRAHGLELEIVDRGDGTEKSAMPGSSHGLVGMRERVALFGGSLDAGPVNGRGYRVAGDDPVHVMGTIRVLIVDDQPLARAGFKAVLEATGAIEVVAEAENGEQAIELARRHDPDVVLMDIRMPGIDGIEATRRMPRQKVVILTTFGLDEYIIEALRAGASGFLLKDAPVEELVRTVQTVAAGDAQLSPEVTKRLLEQVARRLPAAVARDTGSLTELTDREREVLRLMAVGMTNAEIANALFVSEPTVKTHVSSVLQKLGLRDRVQAVIYAYENGLIGIGKA